MIHTTLPETRGIDVHHYDPRIVEAFTNGDCFEFASYLVGKYPHLEAHKVGNYAHCLVKNPTTGLFYDVTGRVTWSRLWDTFFLDSPEDRRVCSISEQEIRDITPGERWFPEVSFEEGEEHLYANLTAREKALFLIV